MARLSPRAAELVRALQERPSFGDKLLGRRLDPSTLRELETLGEVLVAPLLLPFVFDSERETAERVAGVIRALLAGRAPSAALELEEASRSVYGYAGIDHSDWFAMTAKDVGRAAALHDPAALVGVATFHSSGYVRHAAVLALDAMPGYLGIPYLLVRLNDWVTPVADAAKRAILRRTGDWASTWIECLPLVARLGYATRRQHAEVIDAVFTTLKQRKNWVVLEGGFASQDRATQRVCYRLAREVSTEDALASVVVRALQSEDQTVRLAAMRDAASRLVGEPLGRVLARAERDTFAPVRRVALEVGVERFAESAIDRVRRALLDGSASVRELARYLATKHTPSLEIAQLYREQLRTPVDVAAVVTSLAGIAETGGQADAARVSQLLTHPRAAIRAQAVRALGKLDPEAHANVFVASLSDASPRVAHAARSVLEQYPSFIDYATISRLVQHGTYPHTRADALRLGATLGKWASLILWLEASDRGEPAVAERARERIAQWLARANFRYTAPRASDISSIQTLLARSDGSLSAATLADIRGFLQPWSAASE
jgi:hypothetical protein